METQNNELSEEYLTKSAGYYKFSRSDLVPDVPASARYILEVGCSSGGFGTLLKQSIPGCSVRGIEPDQEAAAIAATLLSTT